MIPSCALPPPTHAHSLSTIGWSIAGSTQSIENWTNPKDPYQHIQIVLREGDVAYDQGDPLRALAKYREATAGFIAQSQWSGLALDEELHLARVVALMHDRATARTLWRLYLRDAEAAIYADQAQRLRTGNFTGFFRSMQDDSEPYTGGHPADQGTADAIARGAAAGARGNLAAAQSDFDEAVEGAVYSSAYAIYAWGAAAWARGDRTDARRAWLCASDAGHDPIGDMAFHSAGNSAAVTMLLNLSSP